ncbi:cytochrome c oxidase subunit 3 [Pontibacter sp. G13]|uniref:cytochrome c oxidase subunit 3 n=1 Tax=Pontibacter sp. G13 TaxID=3074898 RepID=UPI00288C2A0D|nr:cytochrome c oxidase subunit 3 [Pontibacter sp. G13]WNJ16608.1 cytochrome c oxidase subunit 3 [Pontibacter sp. G13]
MSQAELTSKQTYFIHPQKFAMWLFILTIIMIFGGLTSAYIVQRGMVSIDKQIMFDLPSILWQNLAVILLSSVSMQYGVWAAKEGQKQRAAIGLLVTFALGVFFLIGQLDAWSAMTNSGLPFVDQGRPDNSVSFFYIFIGLHGLHIVAGLVVLLVAMIKTAMNTFRPGRGVITYELTAIFWHFLGLLWVYLFFFLMMTQN